jgi:hypothetical protein
MRVFYSVSPAGEARVKSSPPGRRVGGRCKQRQCVPASAKASSGPRGSMGEGRSANAVTLSAKRRHGASRCQQCADEHRGLLAGQTPCPFANVSSSKHTRLPWRQRPLKGAALRSHEKAPRRRAPRAVRNARGRRVVRSNSQVVAVHASQKNHGRAA